LISSPQTNCFDHQKGTDIQTVYFSDQHNVQITEGLRQVPLHGGLTENSYLVSSLLVIISYIFPFPYQTFMFMECNLTFIITQNFRGANILLL
jgi:hypothetical protein